MPLKDPDEKGLWYVERMGVVAFSFNRNDRDEVTSMSMFQINQLVKKSVEPGSAEEKEIQKILRESLIHTWHLGLKDALHKPRKKRN